MRSIMLSLVYIAVAAAAIAFSFVGGTALARVFGFLSKPNDYSRILLLLCMFFIPRLHPMWTITDRVRARQVLRDTCIAWLFGFGGPFIAALRMRPGGMSIWDVYLAGVLGVFLGAFSTFVAFPVDAGMRFLARWWRQSQSKTRRP